jgi:aspartyl-tRNA(Asn)/glutamyl-tRNA(Gln) amidotransferase subunit A
MDPITRRRFVAGTAAGAAAAALGRPSPSAARSRSKTAVLPDARVVAARHAHPADLGVLECASLLQARLLSPNELLAACRERIAKRNGGPPTFDGGPDVVNAWIRLYDDTASAAASAATRRLSRASVKRAGRAAPLLCGIPLGLKDLYAVAGKPLTASSHVLDGNVAPGDSTVWERLRFAGMVLLGHTHTHEFAAGASTDQVGNPWDVTRTPAGSSGGSAAALSARMIPAATGTDTGGSLRMPSAVCGTSTIKPTIGRVSTHGVVPLGFTLDHAGPMARSIADVSLLLSYMAGPDPHDPATLAFPAPDGLYATRPRRGARPLAGLRLGVPRARIDAAGLEAGVAARFDAVLAECRALGAELVDVSLPAAADGATTSLLEIEVPEFLLYHQQFAARITRYRPALQAFFAASATPVPAVGYLAAQRARLQLVEELNALYAAQRLDALIEPTTPIVAPARNHGEGNLLLTAGLKVASLTALWDLTGMPVVAIPAGLTPDSNLPCGVSLIGCAGEEPTLLQTAIDLQAHNPHHEVAPKGLA